jgi:hypothetical protein
MCCVCKSFPCAVNERGTELKTLTLTENISDESFNIWHDISISLSLLSTNSMFTAQVQNRVTTVYATHMSSQQFLRK